MLVLILLLCILPTAAQAQDTDAAATGADNRVQWVGTDVVWKPIAGATAYSLTISSRVPYGSHSSVIESDMYVRLDGTYPVTNCLYGRTISVTYDKNIGIIAHVGDSIVINESDLYSFNLAVYYGGSSSEQILSGEIYGSSLLNGAKLCTVTYYVNGGSGSMAPHYVYSGTLFLLPECTLTPPKNSYFECWKGTDGKTYAPGDGVQITENTGFYAVWKQKTWIANADAIITVPVGGETPDFSPTAYLPEAYSVSVVSWYLFDFDSGYPHLSSTDKFVEGKKYAVRIQYVSKTGYYTDEYTDFYINGKGPTKVGGNTYQYVFTAEQQQEAAYNVRGTVTSFLDDGAVVTVRLRKSGSWLATKSVTVTGNNAYYAISDLVPATYYYSVMKENHVTRTGMLSVTTSDRTLDAWIHPFGDIDGDGEVTNFDYGRVNSHARGKSTLSGYEFSCGDIDGDGELTNFDAGRINSHARCKSSLWE